MDYEILAEGLRFPEGPIAMEDGSVILVEIARGTLTRCWKGRSEIIANIGGGPNGAAIGPDGAVYICNNGGTTHVERNGIMIPTTTSPDYVTGRIERVNLSTGKVERVYDKVGDFQLRGPNDLVFDRAGNFWFTDYGKDQNRSRDKSGIYYASPNGSKIVEVAYGSSGYNGIGLSPDEKTLYAAETSVGRLWAIDIVAQGEIERGRRWLPGRAIATMPGQPLRYFDSLAVTASGRACVATPDRFTTNIAFGGKDMRDAFITFSATGKLAKARWSEPGLKLNFNG